MRYLHTETGSIYAVDDEAGTVERLGGSGPPTERVGQGPKRFHRLVRQLDGSLLIVWRETSLEDGRIHGQATVTSRIVSETLAN